MGLILDLVSLAEKGDWKRFFEIVHKNNLGSFSSYVLVAKTTGIKSSNIYRALVAAVVLADSEFFDEYRNDIFAVFLKAEKQFDSRILREGLQHYLCRFREQAA